MDRIHPLPQSTREALIDLYSDDDNEIREAAKKNEDNKHCLVRVYLGEHETPRQKTAPHDSLQNFPLHLNMIEDLKLDKTQLANEIAITLAVLHWQAKIDGMDSEFVLGSSSVATPSERRRAYQISQPPGESRRRPCESHRLDFNTGATQLRVLDFDKASPIEFTVDDVDKKLVPAFLANDPYYPRPDVDEELSKGFCETYLKASHVILEDKLKSEGEKRAGDGVAGQGFEEGWGDD